MTLTDYKRKRDFGKTPEPVGNTGSKGLIFVVQKHDASRLHYDFRLELEGVLKSWAVPKGPSLDPSVKRLAMMVEDHPFDYKDFEGVIPKGNYGAGTVMIWDRGTYHSTDSDDPEESEKILKSGLSEGELKFVLHGTKLQGEFALVRIKSGENSWLLIKKKDQFAASGDITLDDRPVTAGKTAGKRVATPREKTEAKGSRTDAILENAPPATMPHKIKPMLATLIGEPFDHPDWLFEIKHDGYRAIAEVHNGRVLLYSRKNLPFNKKFPVIARSLAALDREAVYDGEIVVVDEKGKSSFQLLQIYSRTGEGNICYFIFDMLYLDGRDLRNLPLVERKELLREILPDLPRILYSDHVWEYGKTFFQMAKENKLEGIICKLGNSRYAAGIRSRDWLKVKIRKQQEAIICGFTEPRQSRKYFGALILGAYHKGELVYIGHSGGGFDETTHKRLYDMLLPLVRRRSPFKKNIKTNMPVKWVEPVLVCETAFTEWTRDGSLRMPIFLEMREDKDPRSVVKETVTEREPEEARLSRAEGAGGISVIAGKRLKLTNMDKVFWPDEKYTKGDVIEYYREMAEYILPYLIDRPHSLYRFPHGIQGESFYQKDMGEYAPGWLTTAEIYSESQEKPVKYLICKDEASLVYMANLGCIEINPWLSRVRKPDYPDYLVIDLDPENLPFEKVIEAAVTVKEVLDRAGAESFPKTSGATGIHIYVPLGAKYDYDTAGNFARLIATIAQGLSPGFTSIERSPDRRQKKVYLDYLQNKKGRTVAAPYCIRPRPGAPVSAPLTWEEVKEGLDPLDFNIKTIRRRVQERGDLFHGVLGPGIDMEKCIGRLENSYIRRSEMPYEDVKDLPESVKKNLPPKAQKIYLEAYNSAWEEYEDPKDRRGDASREEVSHKVAWSAVKQQYEKDEKTGKWKQKK